MVGILVSFWDGLFSGAMLVSGKVHVAKTVEKKLPHPAAGAQDHEHLIAAGRRS